MQQWGTSNIKHRIIHLQLLRYIYKASPRRAFAFPPAYYQVLFILNHKQQIYKYLKLAVSVLLLAVLNRKQETWKNTTFLAFLALAYAST